MHLKCECWPKSSASHFSSKRFRNVGLSNGTSSVFWTNRNPYHNHPTSLWISLEHSTLFFYDGNISASKWLYLEIKIFQTYFLFSFLTEFQDFRCSLAVSSRKTEKFSRVSPYYDEKSFWQSIKCMDKKKAMIASVYLKDDSNILFLLISLKIIHIGYFGWWINIFIV